MRTVELRPRAEKDLRRVAPQDQEMVRDRILALAADPTPPASKPMKGEQWRGWHTLRIGAKLRVLYRADPDVVLVARVIKRGQGYPDSPPE